MSQSFRTFLARTALTLIALLITLGIGIRWFASETSTKIELLIRDFTTPVTSAANGTQGIALIDIDELSIHQTESWPWRRSLLGDLIVKAIDTYDAKLVVLDIVLPDPRDTAGDKQLLALAQSRKLVLAQVFDFVERDSPIINGSPSGPSILASAGLHKEAPIEPEIKATGIIGNHEGLRNAPCVGNIGFIPDPDGKLRRIVNYTIWEGKTYPSLALAAIDCIHRQPPKGANAQDPATLMPRSALMPLRFDVPPSAWTVVSAKDLLINHEELTPVLHDAIRGKIIIIGSSALGLSDRVSTPKSASISGMFIHAQAISELLHPRKSFISAWSLPTTLILQMMIVLTLGLVAILSRNLRTLIVLSVLLVTVWIGFFTLQVDARNPHSLTAALWGMLFVSLTVIPLELYQARAQSRARAKILARYVSKPVLKELLQEQSFDPLKPRSADITVLVADMVAYSEKIAGQNLENAARITRGFLDALTQPVWATRGTLDRYTGDGLVAFWGAPIPSLDHPQLAIQAARAMQDQITLLNQTLKAQGLPMLSVRIGIASGPALVGDFGTKLRASYTAVGTCINMAARLEAAAKELHVPVAISSETARALGFEGVTFLGEKEIRGIGKVSVYTIA